MTEHDHLAALLKVLRRDLESSPENGVVTKLADGLTSGNPDVVITVNAMTSWWEVKATDAQQVTGTGLQHVTARRLAQAGTCWYVVYQGTRLRVRTCLVRPRDVGRNGYFRVEEGNWVDGIDHLFVLAFVRKVHGV